MKKERGHRSLWTSGWLMVCCWVGMVIGVWGCGEESESKGIGQADADQVAYNREAKAVREAVEAFSKAVVGDGGLMEKAQAMSMSILKKRADGRGIEGYHQAAKAYVEQLYGVQRQSATLLLRSLTQTEAFVKFAEKQASDFAETSEGSDAGVRKAVQRQQKGVVLASLIAIGAVYSAYSAYSSVNEAVKGSQKIVTEAIYKDEAYRKVVTETLESRGVEVPSRTDPDELDKIFKEQGRETRRVVTNAVRDLNMERMMGDDGGTTDDAQLAESDQKTLKTTAVELGKVAVTQVVAGTQAVTGGIGEFLGGKELGAAVDLTLSVTEMDPMSVLGRHLEVKVASKETSLPDYPPLTEEDDLTAEEAEVILTKMSRGEDEGDALAAEKAGYHQTAKLLERYIEVANGTQGIGRSPVKMVFAETDLEATGTDDEGKTTYTATVHVPMFEEGEAYQIEVIHDGYLHEEHQSDAANTPKVELDNIPLTDTLSASVVMGDYTDHDPDAQAYEATLSMKKVVKAVEVHAQIENGTVSPAVAQIAAEGDLTFTGEIMNNAQLVMRRYDTGESYTLTMKLGQGNADIEPDAGTGGGGGAGNLDMNLIGTWHADTSDGDYDEWIFRADGTCVHIMCVAGNVTRYEFAIWTADGSTLMAYVNEHSAANTYTYRVAGGVLQFYASSVDTWSVEYRRQ